MGDILSNNGTGHISHLKANDYIKDEIDPSLSFCEAGVVAMANKGPDTNGSQFFITLDDLPFLNGKYTIIGQTIDGYHVLKRLASECGTPEGQSKCNVKISKTGIFDYKEYTQNKILKF